MRSKNDDGDGGGGGGDEGELKRAIEQSKTDF